MAGFGVLIAGAAGHDGGSSSSGSRSSARAGRCAYADHVALAITAVPPSAPAWRRGSWSAAGARLDGRLRRAGLDLVGGPDRDAEARTWSSALPIRPAQGSRGDDHRRRQPARLHGRGRTRAADPAPGPGDEGFSRRADAGFVEGIRISLAAAMVFLALVLAAGFAGFPRGKGSITDAEREARKIESEESAFSGEPGNDP